MAQLVNEDALLRNKIKGYEDDNNQLDADINSTIDDLTALDV